MFGFKESPCNNWSTETRYCWWQEYDKFEQIEVFCGKTLTFELPYSFSLTLLLSSYFPSLHSTMLILSVSHFSLLSWNGRPLASRRFNSLSFSFFLQMRIAFFFLMLFHGGIALPYFAASSVLLKCLYVISIHQRALTLFTPITGALFILHVLQYHYCRNPPPTANHLDFCFQAQAL